MAFAVRLPPTLGGPSLRRMLLETRLHQRHRETWPGSEPRQPHRHGSRTGSATC